MKIDVLCTRELDFEGSGGAKNRSNFRCFLEGLKRASWGGTFGDFIDFWGPVGIRRGSILAQKGIFLGV